MSSDPSGQDFSARASDHARMYQQGSGTQYNVNFLSLGSSSAQNGLDWTLNADFWPAVREVDPLELGVHRAPMTGGNAVPAYVQRDSDTEVSKAMQALVRSGGMAVLVGDSTAGKSRSAYDAMLRIAPEWKLYQPNISVPLSSSILALLNQQEKFFVWLDDLERYIGPGGLSSGALPYLRRAGIAIVATIRAEQYRRLSAVTAVQDDSHSTPDFERIVEQSIVIDIKRQWSKQEVSRAILVDDIRVKEAVNQAEKFGIAEYLAAGPKLLSEYETAWAAEANPRGASIVAAAIDCVRAGLNLALDRGFLTHLHEIYLQDRGGSLLRPEPIESAFSWALRRRSGVASLLIEDGGDGRVRVFDYLSDEAMRDSARAPVPQSVWNAIVEYLTNVDADGLLNVSEAALAANEPLIAESALTKAAKSGSAAAALRLGFWFRGLDEAQSLRWLASAADLGEPDGLTFIGLHYEKVGNLEEAEKHFRQSSEAGCVHGMTHLANFLADRGKFDESVRWFRNAERLGEDNLSVGLAYALSGVGDLAEAQRLYEAALASGDPQATIGLGILFAKMGRHDEAVRYWELGVSRGVAAAAARLAMHHEEYKRYDRAQKWWREAIKLGDERAQIGLAIALDLGGGRTAEAEELFRTSAESCLLGAKRNYAVFLRRKSKPELAESWAREAYSDGDMSAAILLAELIAERDEKSQEVIDLLTEAVNQGIEDARAFLGHMHAVHEDFDTASRFLEEAVAGGDMQAGCELGSVRLKQGNQTLAEECFRSAAKGGHAHAACVHGQMLMDHGEPVAAAERFESAFQMGHLHAGEKLVELCLQQGRGKEAAAWMRRIERLGPAGRPPANRIKRQKNRKRRKR